MNKGVQAVIWIAGVAAIGYAAYWFLVLTPQRKHCMEIAAQTYSEQTTNYLDGLITADQYKQAGATMEAANEMCARNY